MMMEDPSERKEVGEQAGTSGDPLDSQPANALRPSGRLQGTNRAPTKEERQSVQGNIAIKGTRNGLLLTLEPETPFGELLNALSQRLSEAPGFFRGASLALDTSRRMLRMSERTQLEDLLAHYQMSVTSLEQVTPAHKYAEAGTVSSNDMASNTVTMSEILETQRDPRETDDTLFLRRTIRSGQAVHHASNIVILGDVNPGAEIV